jgi:hypothetical protein
MTPRIQQLDRLTLVAPLGLRFFDFTRGTPVGSGLDVQVYPSGHPLKKVPALANRSGVYIVHHAPGLRDLEHGEGDQSFWKNLPAGREFVIEVNDNERRFQPFQFVASLPAKGLYEWIDPVLRSPLTAITSIPLYSTPVRAVPSGMAAVRADLWDRSNNIAAAWTVMEAFLNDRFIARGVADEKGRIALVFPYPAPRSFTVISQPGSPLGSPLGSPPTASTLPLTEQVWSIRLRAFYTAVRPIAAAPEGIETKPELPDLRFTLSQPEATIWSDVILNEPLLEVSLHYGRELVLQSEATTSPLAQLRQSVLFITPAVSPP